MALIRARHAVYGVRLVPAARVALHPDEWTPLDEPADHDEPAAPADPDHGHAESHTPGDYDPADHRVDDVLAWLARADAAERGRVIALERARTRPRKTVLAYADTSDAQTPAAPRPGTPSTDRTEV